MNLRSWSHLNTFTFFVIFNGRLKIDVIRGNLYQLIFNKSLTFKLIVKLYGNN